MRTDILGRPYAPGRFFKDGSRPYHARSSCQGSTKLTATVNNSHPCPWHAPSRHKMRNWPRVIRFDKYGLVERVCRHGVGHPDPDSLAFIGAYVVAGPDPSLAVHGCDGCCS